MADTCTITLSGAASATAVNINLSSNNPAVTLPAVVTVRANTTSVQFTANLASVGTQQTATLTASTATNSRSIPLTLLSAISTLVLQTPNVVMGYVPLNTTMSQPVTILASGSMPLIISAATVNGTGFQVSGASFPMTLTPGQKATLNVQFTPIVVGSASGQILFVSNSSTGSKITTLSATGGVPPIGQFICTNWHALGAMADTCTITLSGAASATPVNINLSSNNPAVTLPAVVTVRANTTSVQFTANLASVGTQQTVTLTASTGTNSRSIPLTLLSAISTLALQTPTVAMGYVPLNTTVSQPITLVASGSVPLIISAATVTGAGFQVSGASFPMTLTPGQKATLNVQFTPTVVGSASGQILFVSNSSTGSKITTLSATGSPVGKFPGSPVLSILTPPTPATPISSDYSGMTVYWLTPQIPSTAKDPTPFPQFPVSILRLWDVDYWANIEYRSGKYDWVKMDGNIAAGGANGVKDFLFTFGQPPNWASSEPSDPCPTGEGPGTCSMPNMTAYDAFATSVVQRYCGKIKYYEPWNEPNNSQFWDGTNAQMLTIAQHLYGIAKDPANCGCTNGSCSPNGGVNPNKVLLPPISNTDAQGISWLDSYLASANLPSPYADIASFHGYVWHGYPPEEIAAGVQRLKQTLGNHGLANLDLWNTEVSWGQNTYYDEQQQAAWLMRSYTTEAAVGVSRFMWYAYDQCDWGTLWTSPNCSNNQSPASQLNQAGYAYGTIENWLTGANLTQCQQYLSGLWACELLRPNNYDAWMLWSTNGTAFSVTVPSDLGLGTYRDAKNGVNALSSEVSVSGLPILLEK